MQRDWLNDLRREERSRPWLATSLIWLITAVSLLIGWGALVQQIRHEEKEAVAAAVEQTRNRAIAFEQYVARTLEAADLVTRHVGEKYARDTALESGAAPRLIDDRIARSPLIRAVHVVAPSGRMAASTIAGLPPADLSDHPVFLGQQRIPDDRLQITPPLESEVLPGRYIHVTRRVFDGDGRTAGYVGAQIVPAVLSSFLRDASFRPTDLISVIGFDGITLARREGDRISAGEDLSGRLVMKMQRAAPNGTYVGPSSLDGHVRYFSHRRLENYPVFVTAGVSRDAVLAPVRERARVYEGAMLALTLIVLLFATVVSAVLNRRQRRAEALLEANRRLRSAQRLARIGDWEYDVATGELLWSDQLCEMYEREPACDTLTLDEFRAYLDVEGERAVDQAIRMVMQTGEPQTYELTVHLPSGAASHRYIKAIPERDESGAIVRVQGTDQDISADRLLRELESQVAHLARVDAMNTMASTLAHELNQPLTAATNYLTGGERLLESGTEDDRGQAAGAVREARRQVLLAGQIIRRVRDMIGSRSHEAGMVPLADTIGRAAALLRHSGAGERIPITIELAPDAEFVWADPVQVQQVLMNVIKNAFEAAADNRSPRVVVATRRKDNHVLITVEDNGRGLESEADAIFSSFASTKKTGLGLGLSISRTIVEYHRGRIWVESSGPTGTVIAITLPAGEPQAPAEPAAASLQAARSA